MGSEGVYIYRGLKESGHRRYDHVRRAHHDGTDARILRSHIGSRPVNAKQNYGVPYRTLSYAVKLLFLDKNLSRSRGYRCMPYPDCAVTLTPSWSVQFSP